MAPNAGTPPALAGFGFGAPAPKEPGAPAC